MTKGFYDFDFDVDDGVIAKNWGVDEVFYLRNLRSRKLYLSDDIDECIIDSIVRHILQYNADDKIFLWKNANQFYCMYRLMEVRLIRDLNWWM